MATSILISIQICKYEKYKIIYCDKMIYLASQVSIFMKSVMPDTDMIFSYLKNSEKLKDIDIFDINSTSPLNKVENEKIEKILRAAMQASTAGNQQEWEFIVIDDKEIPHSLANISPYSSFLKNASF